MTKKGQKAPPWFQYFLRKCSYLSFVVLEFHQPIVPDSGKRSRIADIKAEQKHLRIWVAESSEESEFGLKNKYVRSAILHKLRSLPFPAESCRKWHPCALSRSSLSSSNLTRDLVSCFTNSEIGKKVEKASCRVIWHGREFFLTLLRWKSLLQHYLGTRTG